MSLQRSIENKIQTALAPTYIAVENESHMHGGPATESHFKLTVVSNKFDRLSLVKRHQQLYGLLAEEMSGPVHALALHLYTDNEWERKNQVSPDSPNCRGGSKTNA